MFGVAEKQTRKMKYKKTIVVFVAIILAFLLVSWLLSFTNKKEEIVNIEQFKNDATLDYVFSAYKFHDDLRNANFEVPNINLKNVDVDKINNKFLSIYTNISDKDEYLYDYKYSVSDNILSIYLEYGYIGEDNPIYKFISYNIDVANGKVLSDDEVLDRYDLNINQIESFIRNKFKNMYNDMIKKEYFTSKYSFNRFVNDRDMLGYKDNISFYIDNGSLIAFKEFNRFYSDKEFFYFGEDSYRFVVVDGDKK